jgi:uncharacterized delta-60 repeat protein
MSQSIAFIDSRVSGYRTLIDSLPTGTDWVLLDAQEDGLLQMQRALTGLSGLDAIHIVSHGSPGMLYLGSTVLDAGKLAIYQSQLQALGASLSDSGDILLYGCNVAAGTAGAEFVAALAQVTGADVAASTDATGPVTLGGDGVLEHSSGLVEVPALAASNLGGLLAVAGVVTTDFRSSYDHSNSMAVEADGKILVAGSSDFSFALARYNADGSLDTSFSGDGKVSTGFGLRASEAKSVTVQADGKILVAGSSHDDFSSVFALARYNVDGSLDINFGEGGKVTTDFGLGYFGGNGVTALASGKILVAGYSDSSPYLSYVLARYNADGSLDTSFSTDGKLITDTRLSDDDISSTIVQPDGKILVAGTVYSDSGWGHGDFALTRYNADGSLDTSFSGDGKLMTDFGAHDDIGRSVAVQSDGKILVAGDSLNSNWSGDFALSRYNADGSLDISFGDVGKVTTDFGGHHDSACSVTVQADGSILVAGSSYNGNNDDFALARYNADGSLDTSFSGDGMLTTDLGATDDATHSVVVQADGKILVTGHGYSVSDIGDSGDFVLVRYNADGSLDTTFGTSSANSVNHIPSGSVSLTGKATQGQTLNATNTLADADGLGDISYTWYANGSSDPIGFGSNYTLTQAEIGKTISVTASYTDGQGTFESVSSVPTAVVANGNGLLLTGSEQNETLVGGFGDDTLQGLGGADSLDGQAGSDSIEGGEGDDSLEGNFGHDTLLGGAGNDMLNDDQGSNWLDGGVGHDSLTSRSLTGQHTLQGGDGRDSLNATGAVLNLDGGADNDYLYVTGGLYQGGSYSYVQNGQATLVGGAGDDQLQSSDYGTASLDGGDGNDYLNAYNDGQARDGMVTLLGGVGQDNLTVLRYSQSSLDGGEGNDYLSAEGGYYYNYYSDYSNYSNQPMSSSLVGGAGDDQISASWLSSANLAGGDGADSLNVSAVRSATLSGEAGADSLWVDYYGRHSYNTDRSESADESYQLDGGDGDDVLFVSGSSRLNEQGQATVTLLGGAGNDSLEARDTNAGQANGGGQAYGMLSASLDGGAGVDTLTVRGVLAATLTGGAEADKFVLTAQQYRTQLEGTRSYDYRGQYTWVPEEYDEYGNQIGGGYAEYSEIWSEAQAEAVVITDFEAGVGGDVLDYSDLLRNGTPSYDGSNPFGTGFLKLEQAGADTLLSFDADGTVGGGAAIVVARLLNVSAASLVAGNFNPNFVPSVTMPSGLLLRGSSFDDKLHGGYGADTITGFAGNDTLTGSDANDTFVYQTSDNWVDTITDFSVGDRIHVEGAGFTGMATVGTGVAVGANQVQIENGDGITTLYIGTDAMAGADLVVQLQGLLRPQDLALDGTDLVRKAQALPSSDGPVTLKAVAGQDGMEVEVWVAAGTVVESADFVIDAVGGTLQDIAAPTDWMVTWSAAADSAGRYRGGLFGIDAVGGEQPYHLATLIFAPAADAQTLSVTLSDMLFNDVGTSQTVVLDLSLQSSVGVWAGVATVQEQGGDSGVEVSFEIRLDQALLTSQTLNWTVQGSGAHGVSAADFADGLLPEGTLTFGAGEVSKTVTVRLADDAWVEHPEGLQLCVTGASSGILLDAQEASAVLTVTDDDLPVAHIEAVTAAVDEAQDGGSSWHTFKVMLDQAPVQAQTLAWAVVGSGDHAVDADDFAAGVLPQGVLEFAEGETEKLITVEVRGDRLMEQDEQFRVTLSDPSTGLRTGTASEVVATIANDDGAPLTGMVYHWKNHALLSDVQLQLNPELQVAQPGLAAPLFELRNTGLDANGYLQAELWVNLSEAAGNLDLTLGFDPAITASFTTAGGELPSGWMFESSTATGSLNLAAIGINAASGSLKLGHLSLDLPAGQTMVQVALSQGAAGETQVLQPYEVTAGYLSDKTAVEGSYRFEGVQADHYGLVASKALTSAETGAAISSADALAALKLAVMRNPNADPDGSGPLQTMAVSPYQYIAADANADGKVNSADALAILKMAVNRADAPVREWLFVSESEDFWNELANDGQGAFTTTRTSVVWDRTITVDSPETSIQNLVALLKGDVNGNWTAPAGSQVVSDSHFHELELTGVGPSIQWGVQPI